MLVQGIAMGDLLPGDDHDPAGRRAAGARSVGLGPVATSLRITAGGFAASIATTFWDRREALHQTRLAESSSAYSANLQEAVNGLHGLGVDNTGSALGVLTQSLVHQAYLLSSLDYFWISGWLTLAPLLLVWLARRPRGKAAAAAE